MSLTNEVITSLVFKGDLKVLELYNKLLKESITGNEDLAEEQENVESQTKDTTRANYSFFKSLFTMNKGLDDSSDKLRDSGRNFQSFKKSVSAVGMVAKTTMGAIVGLGAAAVGLAYEKN